MLKFLPRVTTLCHSLTISYDSGIGTIGIAFIFLENMRLVPTLVSIVQWLSLTRSPQYQLTPQL